MRPLSMLGLAIHTAGPQLGLMLQGEDAAGEPVSRYQTWDLGREVSSQLHVKMMAFVKPYGWEDVSFVAVAKGPGGFTGTRIGVVAARTLAQQLEIPLFGVSSLAALAADAVDASWDDSQDISVMMSAKREAVYGAIFRLQKGEFSTVREEAVLPKSAWDHMMAQWPAPLSCKVEILAGSKFAYSVRGVMALALAAWESGERPHWSSVMPFYGQHPVR